MHSSRQVLISSIGLILSFLPRLSAANDSAMRNVAGGTVQPMKEHSSITMVSETVDMKLGEAAGWEWPAFVRCQFVLKNNGPATDVLIGFPEHATGGGDGSSSKRLSGFKSWVDHQPVKLQYLPSSKNKKDSGDSMGYKAWYTKKVHFDEGQTRVIVDVYSLRLGIAGTAGEPSINLLDYTLVTGTNWHGAIGSAVIRADLTDAADFFNIIADPKGYTRKGNVLTWTFKDFEPKEDIGIGLEEPLFLLNGVRTMQPWLIFVRSGVLMVGQQFLVKDPAAFEDQGIRRTITSGSHTLTIRAGAKSAMLDGKRITLHTAPWMGKRAEEFAVPLEETVRLLGGSIERMKDNRINVILK